jgi:hypothetical protein
MTAPDPTPTNPYRLTLGILALAGLILGPILLIGNQPHESYGLYVEGSAAGRVAGALLLVAGTVFGAAWLTVAALQWKPRTPRPASPESASDSPYDRVAPEPPR